MLTQRGYLLGPTSARVAVLDVTLVGDLFSGTICLDATPPELEHHCQEFEEMVEGQVFEVADEIEEKIGKLRLRVAFANGPEADVSDLQVYPSTKRVSFGIRQSATVR